MKRLGIFEKIIQIELKEIKLYYSKRETWWAGKTTKQTTFEKRICKLKYLKTFFKCNIEIKR